jgi:hypothetical protein
MTRASPNDRTPRLAQARRLTAASRLLAAPEEPERRRTIAMRAAFALPTAGYTHDPLGGLAGGRYDALVAAALDDAGLRAPQFGRR